MVDNAIGRKRPYNCSWMFETIRSCVRMPSIKAFKGESQRKIDRARTRVRGQALVAVGSYHGRCDAIDAKIDQMALPSLERLPFVLEGPRFLLKRDGFGQARLCEGVKARFVSSRRQCSRDTLVTL
jgi:hypothetical protein